MDNQRTLKGSKCSKSVLYFSIIGLEVKSIQDMYKAASSLWLYWCFIHAKNSKVTVLWLCIVIRPHKGKGAFRFPARKLKSKGLKGRNEHSSLHIKDLIWVLEQEGFFLTMELRVCCAKASLAGIKVSPLSDPVLLPLLAFTWCTEFGLYST